MAEQNPLLQDTAKWIHEQIGQVWCALTGRKETPADGKVETTRDGKAVMYRFFIRDRLMAKAKVSFHEAEDRWVFELTETAKEAYQQVHDYYTKGKSCT